MSYAQETHVPTSHPQTAKIWWITMYARGGLALLLLLAFLHGSLYALFLPPWGLIDEAQHLHYIQYIAEQQALPVAGELYLSDQIVDSLFATHRWQTFHWTPPAAAEAQTMGLEGHSYEAYQPPLFYLAMAPLYQALPQDILVKVYALRMVMVLLSLITVWALYRTVGLLLPRYPHLPFLAGLLLVAIPERTIATSRINNDVLLEVVAALFFMMLTRTLVAGVTARRSLLLGLLVGLAVWVKIPGGLLGIPLLLGLWRRRHDPAWLRQAAWMMIVIPLGVGIAARNFWFYGDFTGFAAFEHLHRLTAVDNTLAGFLRALTSFPNHLWLVWWKGSEVGGNRLVTGFYLLMALVIVASWGRLLLYFWRQRRTAAQDRTPAAAGIYALSVLLYAVAVIGSYYQGMVPVIQGRFLLPAIVPFVLLVSWGLWLYPRGEKIILAVALLLSGMSLFSLFGNLIPYYYYWSDLLQGLDSTQDFVNLWQGLSYIYHRALLDKPAFVAPLLIVLPLCYAGTLFVTFVVALRTINPPRRYFPKPAPLKMPIGILKTFVGSRLELDALARYLLPASMIYLALPHLIFFIGWLQWQWAILASLCLAVGLVMTARLAARIVPRQAVESQGVASAPGAGTSLPASAEQEVMGTRPQFRFTRHHALMIGVVCAVWLILAGIGGIVRQDYDWDKHNVILNSLIQKPWPTVYDIYHEKLPLIYYIGYYLPPALVGKVAGWVGANVTLSLWTLAGLFLAVAWFSILVRRISYSSLLIFVFFSGLDVIGTRLAVLGGIWTAVKADWQHIDSWAGVWQYSSNTTLLFWVPHHALSGWISMGIVAYYLVTLRRRDLILLPVGFSAFWSPFVTLGMIPYLIIDFLIDKEPLWTRIRRMISVPNAVGLLAITITVLYLSARAIAGSPVIINNAFSEWSLPSFDGPIHIALIFLILFCLIEFGLYVIVLYASGSYASRTGRNAHWRWMLHSTVFTLCLLPWFKFGAFNDLVMRASIPALFMLSALITQTVHDGTVARWARVALVIMLFIGVVTPAVEFVRHLQRMRDYLPPLIDETQAPRDFVDYFKTDTFFFGQYTGSVESPFFEYAAKAPPTASTEPEDEINQHDYILYDNKIYLLLDEIKLTPQVAPGTTFTVPIALDFYGLAIRADYNLRAALIDEKQQAIWGIEDWPAGRPPIDAFDITSWTGALTVTVPSTATPGLYHLQLGFYDANTQVYLPARSVPEEAPLGDLVPVGTLQVADDE